MNRQERRRKIIYISGRYSSKRSDPEDQEKDIQQHITKARELAIQVWEAGYTALTPHLNTAYFERDCDLVWQDYIDGDLELVRRCDAVLLIDNWRDSTGAKKERAEAQRIGLPVFESLEALIKHDFEYPIQNTPAGRMIRRES